MSFFDNVGEVCRVGERTIRWTIPSYMQIPKDQNTAFFSPHFCYRRDSSCRMVAFPNGWTGRSPEGWMGVECWIPSLPQGSDTTFYLLSREGKEVLRTGTEKDGGLRKRHRWVRSEELEARSEELLPGGGLRIVCRVVLPGKILHRAEDKKESGAEEDETKNSQSNSRDGSSLMIRFRNLINRGTSPPPDSLADCPNAATNQETGVYSETENSAIPNHKNITDKPSFSIKTSNSKRTDDTAVSETSPKDVAPFKLIDLLTDDDSFSIHTSNSKRTADTAVSETSLPKDVASLNQIHLHTDDDISLNDKDVEILAQILQFRYSGAIPEISPESTKRLLYLAEKCGSTNLMKLMSLDVDSMMSAMTDDTICDIIRLAQLKGETGLLEQVTRLHEDQIIREKEWQIFNKDYMADAKQLRLETLERRRFVNRKKVIPNDFSEIVYRKLVALTCHPNNRNEVSLRS